MYLSPETILFIREHRNDDVHSLALQAKRYPQVDMPLAIVQIAGWQATVSKIPSWHATEGLLYPRHLSLEQCSSEVTALYKASLVHGEGLVDLTGGFGIDCAFLATQFKTVTYIERITGAETHSGTKWRRSGISTTDAGCRLYFPGPGTPQ